MDEALLHKAHKAASDADKAMLSNRPKDAIALYNAASIHFDNAKELTKDSEALRMLNILHLKYASLTQQLQSLLVTEPEVLTCTLSQSSPTRSATVTSGITSSLASARGIPVPDIDGPYVTVKHRANGTGSVSYATNTDDAFVRFNASLEASMNKMHQAAAKIAADLESFRQEQPALFREKWQDVSALDSFYVVPESPFRNNEDKSVIGVKLSRSIAACESVVRRQRDVMRTNLAKLRQDVKMREGRITRELENEIERLVAENEKLKINNGRLRSKWEGLRESAKKRRTIQNDDITPEDDTRAEEDKSV
ncbi:hypothetical protein V1512DRAFT_255646 [Lipomyces arxii]|uniref:uncharacterized protein n=1 Tax=Lipomyces arxii TaxID=56418 RepID=UPI0034CFFE2E